MRKQPKFEMNATKRTTVLSVSPLPEDSFSIHSIFRPDGTILWANPAELDLLGYGRDEYFGSHIARFHADKPVIEDILTCLTRGDTLKDYPARLLCRDGSIRHVLISSSALFDDGKFIHTRCFTRDVTRERQAEEQVSRLHEQLNADL